MAQAEIASYTIYPTCYADMAPSERRHWCLTVVDSRINSSVQGDAAGWVIRPGMNGTGSVYEALNRKGKWVQERSGSRANRSRRYTRQEAIDLALEHVDRLTINGLTAQQEAEHVATMRQAGDRSVIG